MVSSELSLIEFRNKKYKRVIELQKDLYRQIQPVKREFAKPLLDAAEVERIAKEFSRKISDALHIQGKLESYARLDAIQKEIINSVPEEEKDRRSQAAKIYHYLMEKIFRQEMLEEMPGSIWGRAEWQARTFGAQLLVPRAALIQHISLLRSKIQAALELVPNITPQE